MTPSVRALMADVIACEAKASVFLVQNDGEFSFVSNLKRLEVCAEATVRPAARRRQNKNLSETGPPPLRRA